MAPLDDAGTEAAEAFRQRWLQHAPAPPERGDNTYDVFISYRSSDRSWALSLHDALKEAGWEPFLDQYDLVPGANLESSLTDALEASSSGVILWSSRTVDSKWCERERQAMVSIQSERTFNYVFAKLDAEDLPRFSQADLYVDFEGEPEGPRGANLLRLICGLRGVPLAEEAVRLAQDVDESALQALVKISAAVEASNADRLLEIGTSDELGLLASPAPGLAAVQGLISMGEHDKALAVLGHARARFPRSLRARQLEGLALRRLGRFQEAIDVLEEVRAAGHRDPETLGILAAAWNGLYGETGKRLHLRKSRDLYTTAFRSDPTDYYTGINAASKSLFLGEADTAAGIAAEVKPLVEHAVDGDDLWAGSTLAEVMLLGGDMAGAAEQYQRVIDKHFVRRGDLASTREQAVRICTALGCSTDDTARVLAPFELLDE